jgi:4'-phosphopantetheinyl transferase
MNGYDALTDTPMNTHTSPTMQWLVEQTVEAPPDTWLAPAELTKYDSLTVSKRQADWLLGRWTAKRLIQRIEKERNGTVWPLARLEIGSRPDGSPYLTNPAWSYALSISHSHGRAFCVAGYGDPERAIGADLEHIQPRHTQFVSDYFTPIEQQLVAHTPPAHKDTLITLIWSGKEAFLKAIKKGLTVDTRIVSCLPQSSPETTDSWQPLTVKTRWANQTRPWQGWWRRDDAFVLTIVM